MSLIAKQEGGNFDFHLCPQGNHVATCFSVIDLGMQEKSFQGESKIKRMVRVSWELPNELIPDGELAGQPFSISKNYTLSLHEKSVLYKDLTSWRGRAFTAEELSGFDLFNIAGVNCMLNVIHQPSADGSKTYANVSSVSQLPKGMPKISSVNPVRAFSTEEFTEQEYSTLPEWLQNKICLPTSSRDISYQPQQEQPPAIDYDDVPGF
jgi:hypothetical protein